MINEKVYLDWEKIDAYHSRARVPGGWLVKALEDVDQVDVDGIHKGGGWDWRVAMAFVPDPKHEWGKNDTLGHTADDQKST